jgi:hypothetical protein
MNGSLSQRQLFAQTLSPSIPSSIHKTSKSRRRKDVESLARHYNRSRIEHELCALFETDDDDNDDDENGGLFYRAPIFSQSSSGKRRRRSNRESNSVKRDLDRNSLNNDSSSPNKKVPQDQQRNPDLLIDGSDNDERQEENKEPQWNTLSHSEPLTSKVDSFQEITQDNSQEGNVFSSSVKAKIDELNYQLRAKIDQVKTEIDQLRDHDKSDEVFLHPIETSSIISSGLQEEQVQVDHELDQFSAVEEFSIIGNEETLSPKHEVVISYGRHHQSQEEPPSLVMLSLDCSMSRSEETMMSSKSQISYDDTPTITPSIAYFLSANKLPDDTMTSAGLSIADGGDCNDSQYYTASISPSTIYHSHRFGHSKRNSMDMNEMEEESHTVKGYSRSSSKYTTDSPRILDLREKKRFIERNHERKYSQFPALIEFGKLFH